MAELTDLSLQQPPYRLDEAFYEGVRASRDRHRKLDEFIVPGFLVNAGQTFRVILVEGPQIGDVAFWGAPNPKESFSTLRTWEIEGHFVGPVLGCGRKCPGSAQWSPAPRRPSI